MHALTGVPPPLQQMYPVRPMTSDMLFLVRALEARLSTSESAMAPASRVSARTAPVRYAPSDPTYSAHGVSRHDWTHLP